MLKAKGNFKRVSFHFRLTWTETASKKNFNHGIVWVSTPVSALNKTPERTEHVTPDVQSEQNVVGIHLGPYSFVYSKGHDGSSPN